MRLIPFTAALTFLASTASAAVGEPVLLASSRGGWLEAVSLDTLETVSRVRVPPFTESVASDPFGQRLFVAAPARLGAGCCALFALDARSMQMS